MSAARRSVLLVESVVCECLDIPFHTFAQIALKRLGLIIEMMPAGLAVGTASRRTHRWLEGKDREFVWQLQPLDPIDIVEQLVNTLWHPASALITWKSQRTEEDQLRWLASGQFRDCFAVGQQEYVVLIQQVLMYKKFNATEADLVVFCALEEEKVLVMVMERVPNNFA